MAWQILGSLKGVAPESDAWLTASASRSAFPLGGRGEKNGGRSVMGMEYTDCYREMVKHAIPAKFDGVGLKLLGRDIKSSLYAARMVFSRIY